ncbi:gephyrin-like molybdotransferase receptor GlpR [Streptomyces sp. NPDC021093]|uniref:gephyrin-like molybdotransferase receptor GlpR n=1 Tax=Streptomyces sp. NPDC021093 TaxID=3365112 RepID=UPI0037B8F84D
MSSSGLIYAVIVGAWAAYLVPMWLRRQDELNEARPTERFSTAIRLLSGRAAMERRYAKELQQRPADSQDGTADGDPETPDSADPTTDSVDVRAFAAPSSRTERPAAREQSREQVREQVRDQQARDQSVRDQSVRDQPVRDQPVRDQPARDKAVREQPVRDEPPARDQSRRPRTAAPAQPSPASAERARRSKVLARRRRTTVLLFAAFTLGAIVAAVGGLRYLWAPGIPAVLLSAYIVHLRGQEKRRFAFTMDRRRAEFAAQRLREQRTQLVRRPVSQSQSPDQHQGHHAHHSQQRADSGERPEPEPAPAVSPQEAGRRALVEQTDHAEWVDQQRERERGGARGESWEPVPVPLPTYVTAPVAPRATGDLDLGAPGTWSSARSSTADPAGPAASSAAAADDSAPRRQRPQQGRRTRDHGRTPLFDQYDEDERPRAANE